MNRSVISYMTEEAKPSTPLQIKALNSFKWGSLNPFKFHRPPVKDIKVPVIKPKQKKK